MLKFGIRQAGGCGTEAKKTRNPLPNPTSRPKKKAPRPPEAPRRRPEAPGGARRHPGGARRGPREASRGLKGAPKRAPRKRGHQRPPKAPQRPRRPPDGFGSSEGHDRKSPQPFRKILKRYRSARNKTLDQSQADKGGSGNLGRQPETRKGIKLGGCLRKQGWERETNTPVLGLLRTRDAPSHDMPPPHTPGCVGAPYLHVTFSRRAARRPKP